VALAEQGRTIYQRILTWIRQDHTGHRPRAAVPETRDVEHRGLHNGGVVLGIAMVAEALVLSMIGWSHFGLASNNGALYTFRFLLLLYFAVFSVVSARERRSFWATMPALRGSGSAARPARLTAVFSLSEVMPRAPVSWQLGLPIRPARQRRRNSGLHHEATEFRLQGQEQRRFRLAGPDGFPHPS
jgi:hypothetical protein